MATESKCVKLVVKAGRLTLTCLLCILATWSSCTADEVQVLVADGVQLNVVDEGTGPAVLLLHGYTGGVEVSWRKPAVIAGLKSAGYRVIAFDQRGHGKSAKPHAVEQYGTAMVDDIAWVLAHVQVERVHLVGYSMGAVIALKFAAAHPQQLHSVVLAGYGQPPVPREFTPDLEQEVRKNLQQMNLAIGNDARALAMLSTRWHEWDVNDDTLQHLTIPALCLMGNDDAFLADARRLAARMPGLQLATTPGNHATAPQQPEFVAKLLAFLKSVDAK